MNTPPLMVLTAIGGAGAFFIGGIVFFAMAFKYFSSIEKAGIVVMWLGGIPCSLLYCCGAMEIYEKKGNGLATQVVGDYKPMAGE